VHPAGPHNLVNALAAAALARAHGVEPAAVAEGLRTFEPGAHRSVIIAEAAGVSYVDDSKATNPHAADAALRAHERVVWVAGGLLKGADVDGLVADNAGRLDAAVLIGRDRAEFAAALDRHAPDVPVREVETGDDASMLQAVRLAHEFARPGSVVLLAPAAASMDMFTDYAQRGRAFADAVTSVLAENPAITHGG
jgi:UDP-N-acetylmuramoylalanine--D-glutamate ligase